MNTKAKTVAKTTGQNKVTTAIHLDAGDAHVVGIHHLRVMITPEDNCWFAQGLEIDYAASGPSLEAVKSNFARGLRETIHQHLLMQGGIEKLLKVAPQEVWDEFQTVKGSVKRLTTISTHQLLADDNATKAAEDDFPFDGISFIVPKRVSTVNELESA